MERTKRRGVALAAGAFAFLIGMRGWAQEAAPDPDAIRAAVKKALPLIEKSAAEYRNQRGCFSCHHQALPVLALAAARRSGFAIDEKNYQAQLKHTAAFLEEGRDAYLKGRGQGGKTATAGYALWTLETGGWKADETTSAVAEFLLLTEKDRDHWQPPSNRPPSEASSFMATYLAIRGLQVFGTPGQKERIDARVEKARTWLLAAKPKDTEDRVFRLWALKVAGAHENDLKSARKDLLETRRSDGGWSQTGEMESDAYATGSALVALRQAGGLPLEDLAYHRGVKFLLQDQKEDGTWLVQTRSKPIQTYFESGFPNGKHQFISIAASGWATLALAQACRP